MYFVRCELMSNLSLLPCSCPRLSTPVMLSRDYYWAPSGSIRHSPWRRKLGPFSGCFPGPGSRVLQGGYFSPVPLAWESSQESVVRAKTSIASRLSKRCKLNYAPNTTRGPERNVWNDCFGRLFCVCVSERETWWEREVLIWLEVQCV